MNLAQLFDAERIVNGGHRMPLVAPTERTEARPAHEAPTAEQPEFRPSCYNAPARIYALLRAGPMTAAEIQAALPGIPRNVISVRLCLMAKDGVLRKRGHRPATYSLP